MAMDEGGTASGGLRWSPSTNSVGVLPCLEVVVLYVFALASFVGVVPGRTCRVTGVLVEALGVGRRIGVLLGAVGAEGPETR